MRWSEVSAALIENASFADYLLVVIAAIALWFAFRTARATTRATDLQSRPFLAMDFVEGHLAAEIMRTFEGEKIEPWFTLHNSGASPCIIQQIDREWRVYSGHTLTDRALLRSSNPVPKKKCFIAIGAGHRSASIRTQLIFSKSKGFEGIPSDYWTKKELLHFMLTVVFCSADERTWYEAKFTYVLGPNHLELAFPRDNLTSFSYQKPIKRPRNKRHPRLRYLGGRSPM